MRRLAMLESTPTYTKLCTNLMCQKTFKTTTRDKLYCSINCRNRVHRQKARQREAPQNEQALAELDQQRYFMPQIVNPTPELITKTSEIMLAVRTKKAVSFKTTNGYVMPQPALSREVCFGKTLDASEWIMLLNI